MNSPCPNCHHTNAKYLFRAKDRLENKPTELHTLYRCDACHLVFLYPQATSSNYQEYYGTTYISHRIPHADAQPKQRRAQKIVENLRAHVWQDLYQTSFHIQNNQLNWNTCIVKLFGFSKWFRYAPLRFPVRYAKILDVGCGVGTQLLSLQKRGWNTYGLEPSKTAAEYCRKLGLNVQQGFSVNEHWSEPTFDVIMLNQVFEHINDPNQTLMEIYNALKPGGVLMMNMPNFHSVAAYLFKSYWFNLDAPRHNFLFTAKTLHPILHHHKFEILSMYTASSTKGWSGSIEYVLRDSLHLPIGRDIIRNNRIIHIFFAPIVRVCDWLGIGDNVYVIARKK